MVSPSVANCVNDSYDKNMSQTAKTTSDPRIVFFLLYEGVQLLDVAGPAEVLSQANMEMGRQVYKICYIANSASGTVQSSAGLGLAVDALPPNDGPVDLLVVPGAVPAALQHASADEDFMRWLGAAASRAERTASICTGAFLLGQLGLLDGRRVTTHWLGTDDLRRDFPAAIVQDDSLYLEDQKLWTSAGVLSGVDMMLAMVSQDLDSATALRIARSLVVSLIRDGGQSQFSGPIDLQSKASRSDIVSLVGWLESRLQQATTVEQMADRLSTSVRTLHRRCLDALDLTPGQVLSELRLERARNLLHQLNVPLKSIADQCGFANAATFSKAFSQRFSIAPKRYRERFQTH